MKAAVLKNLNSPLEIEDVELSFLKPGQVLVKVLVSGLCGAQLQEIKGHKGNAKFLPHLLGHEGCGIVEKISPGVTTVVVGDKVVMHWRKGEGIEAPFPTYNLNNREITSGKVTTLNEYSIVSENRLTTVPYDTPDQLCALLGCGMTTALGAINNDAQVKFGESVLIIGCGGLGLNLIQAAKLASAYPITCVDINIHKKDLSLSLGASSFITNLENIKKQQYDVILDTTGIPHVIAQSISLLSDGGRCILVGQPAPGQDLVIPEGMSLWSAAGKTVRATQGGDTCPTTDIPRYIKMHKAGLLDVDKIITHEFELKDVNKALDLLRSGNAGRIMIRMAVS